MKTKKREDILKISSDKQPEVGDILFDGHARMIGSVLKPPHCLITMSKKGKVESIEDEAIIVMSMDGNRRVAVKDE